MPGFLGSSLGSGGWGLRCQELMRSRFFFFFFFFYVFDFLGLLGFSEIRVLTSLIALKFDRHIGSSATEMPVKFQNDTISITSNLAASRLREIWW